MHLLTAVHVAVCLVLVFVVLMQRPRSEGLGAAFGGGVTENIFGAQATHVLGKFTVWLGVVFFAITLLLSMLTARSAGGKTSIEQRLLSAPVPKASASATPVASPVILPAASVAPAPLAAPSVQSVVAPSASSTPGK